MSSSEDVDFPLLADQTEVSLEAYDFNITTMENFHSRPILVSKMNKNYLTFISIYGPIFIVGIIGNLWSIRLILSIFWRQNFPQFSGKKRNNHRRKKSTITSSSNNSLNSNLLLYTLALCTTDLVIVSIIPILIADFFSEDWIFGKMLCKSFWIIENGHKIASKVILMAMSFDRFIAIICPRRHYYVRTLGGTGIILIIIFIFILCSLLPINAYAELIDAKLVSDDFMPAITNDGSNESFDEDLFPSYIQNLTSVQKCVVQMPSPMLERYTLYLFIIGFCAPTLVITCCYTTILITIYRHNKRLTLSMSSSHLPTMRVTFMIITLVLLYLICWTPYWTMTLYIMKQGSNNNQAGSSFIYSAIVASHVLVYANSAVNWIPCVLLNRTMRQQHKIDDAIQHNNKRLKPLYQKHLTETVKLLDSNIDGNLPKTLSVYSDSVTNEYKTVVADAGMKRNLNRCSSLTLC